MASKKADGDGSGNDAGKAKKSLEEEKKEALNLFESEEKRSNRKGAKGKGSGEAEASVFGHLKEDDALALSIPGGGESGAGEDEPIVSGNVINLKPPIVVRDLAELMGIKPFKLIQDLMELDVFANQNQSIEPDIAVQVCEKHGFVFEKEKREKGAGVHKVEEVIEEPEVPEVVEEDLLQFRPPVVTFMGHVDHGKTSLLDFYRGSRVVEGEAGGITQHVGAYSVEKNGKRVAFIDTPGHEAFTEMRARGANVTDIVVLVVAADDGLMPTTLEAIDHCRAAGVTIIVAINKVDLPRADVNRVKSQLQERELAPEDWGGSTICVEVSAKTGQGLDDLFEMIGLQAEILELKANPNGPARGTVIEARTEPGKGPTATVMIQSGTLKTGVPFICGNVAGKVKALLDDRGNRVADAGPSTPVEIVGFADVPNVGDELVQMESDRLAKKLSEERRETMRQTKLQPKQRSALETLFANIEEGNRPVLKIILKCDVQGSVEAITGSLREIKSEKISLDIIRGDAGPITESDILLASASDAIVIGFNTKLENKAVPVAKREGVQVKLYSIIYELIDQVKDAMLGMLAPESREQIIGHAEVREVFKTSSGRVGGCYVTDGRINRKARARVLRGKLPVYDGGFVTLRRFKDDVDEVRNGLECGIKLGDFNDYMKDDVIECYELERVEQTL
ncbi:MAG: translation initiation factor IF-2 [Verrucomicrobiae bacterium]|nr:translation initiation factor IF-2 [Verrucomicrobiae bacterium]MCP5539739.1 translation initiation factor IF-2 [Akkermansiaceae bacterium]MCP5549476.1 translation initiation factor IF-2 [Akkermansiaceae bacterium]